jgi:hypothetical protein
VAVGSGGKVLRRRLRRPADGKRRRRRVTVCFQGGWECAHHRGQDRRLAIGHSAASWPAACVRPHGARAHGRVALDDTAWYVGSAHGG